MRAVLLLGLVALSALAGASGPDVVLVPWQEGAFQAGARVGVDGVNAASFPFMVDACHRRVIVDVLYEPPETLLLDQDGIGEVAYSHTFRVELRSGAALVATGDVIAPGYGVAQHEARAGPHEARLVMTQGVDVSWQLRVRGWEVPGEPECLPRIVVSEVEANPAGTDAGAEWIELENLEATEVDLSGWAIRATHGDVPEPLTLPPGTLVPSGGRLVVTFTEGQFLDNVDEVVELSRLSVVRDATPPLSDAADDGRSWQRSPAGGWSFATATPGA